MIIAHWWSEIKSDGNRYRYRNGCAQQSAIAVVFPVGKQYHHYINGYDWEVNFKTILFAMESCDIKLKKIYGDDIILLTERENNFL